MLSGEIMADTESQEASLELISKIVTAYVSNNSVPRSELPMAQKLIALIKQQLSQSEKQARERAHLATRGDRPFFGCNPCQPCDAAILSGSVTNRAAAPHPDTREQ
jgi:hypothetical protein